MKQINIKSELGLPKQVEIVDSITKDEFYQNFVDKGRPVVVKGMATKWKALSWDTEYFRSKGNGRKIAIKKGNVEDGLREDILLGDYLERLDMFEANLGNVFPIDKPGYLHDFPFFYKFPEFLSDIEPFPKELLPRWYWSEWQNYIQFFMGSTGSLTPLHFDTLLTNNLFFQVVGEKKFILVDGNQKELCYMNGWRWANFNPVNPDYEKFPRAKEVKTLTATIGPGDILYIPPGMLHQVHGLSKSISFNIDWHTPRSARKGVATLFNGAPLKNVYYNMLLYLGLSLNIPAKFIFPYYKSYLNYVS